MKTKKILSFIILGSGIIFSVALIGSALAQTPDIQYPVKELGSCQNEASCRAYCDNSKNIKACLDFAEKHNLINQDELQMARKFEATGAKGPGECATKDSCEEFCNDVDHIDECVAFAEQNGLLPPKELEEAKKVQQAIKRGVKPPCPNKKSCDSFCNTPEHIEECIAFAEEAGFISGKELEEAKKVQQAIKRGVKPPSCHGKNECDIYCSEESHFEECINFAEAAGFMSPEEMKMARKTKGKGPGGCKGREECDNFCQKEENMPTCMAFAEEHGLVSKDEAEMMRKTGGKGPGGCKGREECENFCRNPQNQETCFNFAKEHGMIPEEDLRRMEEGKQKFTEALNNAPPAVMECLNSSVGSEMMEKFKSGAIMPPMEIGDKMRECFEKSMGQPGPGMPGGPGGEFREGPGGCKNPEECKAYCETHPEECKNFQQPIGGPAAGGMMQQGIPDINNMPSEVAQCLKSTAGENIIEQIKAGILQPGPEIGDKIKTCFEQFGPRGPEGGVPGAGMPTPPAGQMPPGTGPGTPEIRMPEGCGSPEECMKMFQEKGIQPPAELQQMIQGILPMRPEGAEGSPTGIMQPPTEFQMPMPYNQQQPPEGNSPPPPSDMMAPPPTETAPPPPPPSSAIPQKSLLGTIINLFKSVFGR